MNQILATPFEHYSTRNPAGRVFGIVVDDRLGSPVIRVGLDALAQCEADLLVFLCLPPHDIRQRTDWPDLERLIRSAGKEHLEYETRVVDSPAELLEASLHMRILRLPTDDSII